MFPTAASTRAGRVSPIPVTPLAAPPVALPPTGQAGSGAQAHVSTLQSLGGRAAGAEFAHASAEVIDSLRDSTGKAFMAHAMRDPDLLRIALDVQPGARTAE